MTQNEEYKPLSELINRAFDNLQVNELENANNVMSTWKKIMLRIQSSVNPNEGRNLADHSRVVDYRKGILVIEADHPGWISLLQMHKNYIMKGLKMELPDMEIVTLAFRLKGKRDDVFGSDEKSRQQARNNLSNRVENEEKILRETEKSLNLDKKQENSTKKQDLPPELASVFDNLKKSMLTNSKK